MFGELPVWGLYVRHTNGIKIKNIKILKNKSDYRPACAFSDVFGLNIDQVEISGSEGSPIVILKNVRSLQQKDIKLPIGFSKGILILD